MKNTILLLSLGLLSSCKQVASTGEAIEKVSPVEVNPVVLLKNDTPIASDTASMNDICDELQYINIDFPNDASVQQIKCTENTIFINDGHQICWFDYQGKRLNQIPLKWGNMDISPDGDRIYTYTFHDKLLSCYQLDRQLVWKSRLAYSKEIGIPGHYFACIHDSLFAIANQNYGDNPDCLLLVSQKGKVLKKVPNNEMFPRPEEVTVVERFWRRELNSNQGKVYYHPFYKDTVYQVTSDSQLIPVLNERLIQKVPLTSRTEYTGKKWSEFAKACGENKWEATRTFCSSRYLIVEHKDAAIDMRLANYLIYDTVNETWTQTYNNFENGLKKRNAHFGIYNDYDGGLAFAPDFISNDCLIMVNAGSLQGKARTILPRQLYFHDKRILKGKYTYRSDACQDVTKKKQADAFWNGCDEKKMVLTILKLKR